MLMDLTDKRTVYLLGLLWADGAFSFSRSGGSVNIACVLDDAETIKRICSAHGLTHWRTKQATRQGQPWGRPQFIMGLPMGEARSYLLEWGLREKTCPAKLLSQIPEHLRHYWWRGYLDGDGCLYIGRKIELAFWSTYDQDWTFVRDLFSQLGYADKLHETRYQRKGGRHCSSTIATCHRDAVRAFGAFVYQGDDCYQLGFARKHAKYVALLQLPDSKRTRWGTKRSRHRYVTWQGAKGKWRGFIWRLNKADLGLFATEDAAYVAVQAYLAQHDKPKPRVRDYRSER